MHLLAWEVLCHSVRDEDLEIRSLVMKRVALIARYVVRFLFFSNNI